VAACAEGADKNRTEGADKSAAAAIAIAVVRDSSVALGILVLPVMFVFGV
jgi:hypothetical protein